MEIARALILAGRRGGDTPPWPAAPPGPRHLFPVANEPIISHNLRALRAAGVLEAAILADEDEREPIERAIGDGRQWGLNVSYVPWTADGGMHDALTGSASFIGDEPVLVQRGDALLRDRLARHIASFRKLMQASLFARQNSMPMAVPRDNACSASGLSSTTFDVVMMPRAGNFL